MATSYKFNPFTGQLDIINSPTIAEELRQNIQDNFSQIKEIQDDFENRVVLVEFDNVNIIEVNLNQFEVRPSVEVWVINEYGIHAECFPDVQFTDTKIIVNFHDNYENGYLVFKQ